ncbi:MFS transporter [Thermodesulfobacteriota bacterium]
MSNGPKTGWTSPYVIISAVGVIFLVTAFICWELRAPVPMLDVSQFRNGVFSIGVIVRFMTFMGMSAVRYLLPFHIQSILGFSPRVFGLLAVPAALSMILIAPISGRLSDRYGWKRLTIGGLFFSLVGLLFLVTVTMESSLFVIMIGWVIQRIGLGAFSPVNTSSVLSVVDSRKYGVTSGVLNMIRNAGNVTGIALSTAIVTALMVSRGLPPSLKAAPGGVNLEVAEAFLAGMRFAYLVPAALVVVGMILYSLPLLSDRPGLKRAC